MESVVLVVIAILVLAIFGGLILKKKSEEFVDECGPDCECQFFDPTGTVPGVVKPNGRKCISQNVMRNRDGKRQKVGVLVSCKKNGKVLVGYSLCCKTDVFDEKEAYVLASQRMASSELILPQSVRKDMVKFLGRCERYYKGAKLPVQDNLVIKQ